MENTHQHLEQPYAIPSFYSDPKVQISENPRKRQRKSDHAPQGDLGDNQLKQLAYAQISTPLSELAANIKNDTTTRERQRQIFGMVWLFNSCEASAPAVIPRNRIYAKYVYTCAENNLTPLSPASFGKLVRILFPNITARRLGMRGQTKYHYCGIKLLDDTNNPNMQNFADSPCSTNSPQLLIDSFSINSPTVEMSPSLSELLPSAAHFKYIPNLIENISNNLPRDSIQIPSIYPYLPKDTDFDIADTLFSLYKVHVNTLFENLRFMNLKNFFSCFNKFNGILTSPAIKLYNTERVIEWLRICDILMYKRMIQMLTNLNHSIPNDLLFQLKYIRDFYVKNLSDNLITSKFSEPLIIMKLKLAKYFTNLLNRLIKTIETGQAAARVLSDNNEKITMLQDWSKLNIHEIVNHEIPCSDQNLDMLVSILTNDLTYLFDDSKHDPNLGIMSRMSYYISHLPGKFPLTNPRIFILLSSNLLTTCLREISLVGGQGFGGWWILRCWIDEFIAWNFELGGFLQDDFINIEINKQHSVHTDANDKQNISVGAVDLLDESYGPESDQCTGTFISTMPIPNDILLSYDSNNLLR